MINSSLPKGLAYVETKNLDGETNLKQKQCEKSCLKLCKDEQAQLRNFNKAVISCEGPNENLYKFEGNLNQRDGTLVPIDNDQILLRGSCLRNTDWIVGICVYTGHETKIMKNGAKARSKTSKVMQQTNFYIKITMLLQFSLSLTASVVNYIWTKNIGDDMWYIWPDQDASDENPFKSIATQLGIWFIALMNFVPISMLVTMEVINFIQAFYISADIRICDEPRYLQATVQSSNLNEELGMIHYIFSDKTGTLTQNIMEFKRFSVGNFEYGRDDPDPKIVYPLGITNVNFEDPNYQKHIKTRKHENSVNLKRFFAALGLCHTIIADKKKD